jgi:hypothetical protein
MLVIIIVRAKILNCFIATLWQGQMLERSMYKESRMKIFLKAIRVLEVLAALLTITQVLKGI